MGVEAEIFAAMDRFAAFLHARDPLIVDEFADAADVLLVGSEAGEIARGREEIAVLMHNLFALPYRLRWAWRERTVSGLGEIAWVFAECDVVVTGHDAERRKPYRMTGVFQRIGGDWKWRHFHGSEPA